MTRFEELNEKAKALREKWLPNPVGENDLDAAIKALVSARQQHPKTGLMWRTAQLSDGNIVGKFSDSAADAVLSFAFWWGHDVVWVVDDDGGRIHKRYLESVSVKEQESARWPITDGPVDYPVVVGEPVPVPEPEPELVQLTLF